MDFKIPVEIPAHIADAQMQENNIDEIEDKSDPPRQQQDEENVLDIHVRTEDHEYTQAINPSVDLPIATQINECDIPTLSLGREVIIEGFVVQSRGTKTTRKHLFLFTLISVIILTVSTIEIGRSSSLKRGKEIGVSLNISFSNELRHDFEQISGKEPLMDEASPQYYAWQKISLNFASSASIYGNDTIVQKRVAQRYAILVIQFSLSKRFRETYELQLDRVLPQECEIFSCNEKGEIDTFYFENRWSTGEGGGTIAKEIGILQGLKHIVLGRNGLDGTIPSEIGNLKSLRILDLHGNKLSREIPSEIGQLHNLEWLHLNSNKLSGSITEMSDLKRIQYANFSHNSFMGTISYQMSQFTDLKGLSLYENDFIGSINFLCQKNFTNDAYLKTEFIGRSLFLDNFYTHSAFFGLEIDCDKGVAIHMKCDCCICFENNGK